MSSAPPPDLLLDTEARPFVVRRGRWSIEVRAGQLENIRYNSRAVLRSIRFVVRDENWRTVPLEVGDVRGVQADASLEEPLVTSGHSAEETVSLRWSIEASFTGNSLSVGLRAQAEGDFLRNRLGLVVLHSPVLAGTGLEVRHPDASQSTTRFPLEISPHQPARGIAGLDWHAGGDGGGTRCSLDFSGDVFEMEDQRNWTDASFKTYSTPLAEPFPVSVRTGDTVEQRVVLSCVGVEEGADRRERIVGATGDQTRLVVGDAQPGCVLPELATLASTDRDDARPTSSGRCAWHLLHEVDPARRTWRAALERALLDADDRALDVRIIAKDLDEAAPVLDALAQHASSRFIRIGVFARSDHIAVPDMARALIAELDRRGLDVRVIAGTRAHFTELNRGIGRLESWRGPLTFSITPFMHDTTGYQLVESIAAQREVAENARRLAQGRPLHIGPITVGARFNAVATTVTAPPDRDDLADGYGPAHVPGASDRRTAAPSLGAWLLASVEALAGPGVQSLSYLEEWGVRAACDPEVTRVLAWIAELSGATRRQASADGLVVLAAESAVHGRTVVLVGNLTGRACSLIVPPQTGAATAEAVVVGPGSVRRISWGSVGDTTVD